jgi:hypothetical protein
MAWNYRKFGTAIDPIHKSDLRAITGDYGCDKQFRYKKDALAAEQDIEQKVSGVAACGNAGHETLARALSKRELVEKLLTGNHKVDRRLVDDAFYDELDKEIAGREVVWRKKDKPDPSAKYGGGEKVIYDRVSMVLGALNTLHQHVAAVVAVEAGFIVRVDVGDGTYYWLAGHTDLIYRPKSNPCGLAIGDWKTGATKPCAIELDHGWESGIYSLAVRDGVFITRDELKAEIVPGKVTEDGEVGQPLCRVTCRGVSADHVAYSQASKRAIEAALTHVATAQELYDETNGERGEAMLPTFGVFPDEIRYVHLQDLVPYEKAGDKTVNRREDVAHYGVTAGTKIKYVKGDLRGPAWLPIRRSEHDVPRLQSQLRSVVGTVRMGRFPERIGEKCERCGFKDLCLTTGYEVRGAEKAQVRSLLHVLQGLDDVDDGLSAA